MVVIGHGDIAFEQLLEGFLHELAETVVVIGKITAVDPPVLLAERVPEIFALLQLVVSIMLAGVLEFDDRSDIERRLEGIG